MLPLLGAHFLSPSDKGLAPLGRHRFKPLLNPLTHLLGELREPPSEFFGTARGRRAATHVSLGPLAVHLFEALADVAAVALLHLPHPLLVGLLAPRINGGAHMGLLGSAQLRPHPLLETSHLARHGPAIGLLAALGPRAAVPLLGSASVARHVRLRAASLGPRLAAGRATFGSFAPLPPLGPLPAIWARLLILLSHVTPRAGPACLAHALFERPHVAADALTLLGRKSNLQRGVLGHQFAQGPTEHLRRDGLARSPTHVFAPGREPRLNARQALVTDLRSAEHRTLRALIGPALALLLTRSVGTRAALFLGHGGR